MRKLSLAIITMFLCAVQPAAAIDMAQVRFHDAENDTTRINRILIDAYARRQADPGECILGIARGFIDVPYVAHTLEGEPEMLTVNLDELDCTTFVETALTLAYTVRQNRTSWRDYIYNLEQIRYRGGRLDGYPSRLHYNCDWAIDNIHRGNIIDVTPRFPGCNYVVKTIDFMSANADKYPALADSTNLERVKNTEIGYRSHRYPYIKKADLAQKAVKAAFRNGDIVALTTSVKGLDVTHLGIIVVQNGEPYLLHASSSGGRVMLSDQPLARMLKNSRNVTGVRVYRLAD